MESLKDKAAKGIVWKFFDQGGTQIIQFISGIYIARLLSPNDYGLVGMLAIFLGVSQAFIDSGFRATLVQKGERVTNEEYSVVFFFNAAVSIFFFFLIYFGASSISDFYGEPKLFWIARAMGLTLIFTSFGLIHQVILEKRLNFRTLAKIRIASVIISVVVGLLLAIAGYGVWSLVFMAVSESAVRMLLLWIYNKWYPRLVFNLRTFKSLFYNGSRLLFSGMMYQLNQNIFPLVIGKFFTTTDVGFYSQGRKLQRRIGDFITSSIQNVLFPVQSLIKDDVPRLKNAVRTNVKVTTLVAIPAIMGFFVLAEPFVELFLTHKWIESVYYIQVLSVASVFYVIYGAVSSYLVPIGKINTAVGLSVFFNVVLVALLMMGLFLHVNLKVLIISKVIQELITLIVHIIYSKRFIGYTFGEVGKDILPACSFSVIMSGFVWLIGTHYGISLRILAIQLVLGIFIYVLLNYLFNRKMFLEILSFIKRLTAKEK